MGREAETQSHVEWDRPQAWQPSFIPPPRPELPPTQSS